MNKIPSTTARKIYQALHRLGFVDDHKVGSHITLVHTKTDRETVVSMHSGDLPRGTVRAIIKQSGVSIERFLKEL